MFSRNLHESEKSCDISQEHKTNGEFTCRTELMIKVSASRQITAIGWGRGGTRGAGVRKRGRKN